MIIYLLYSYIELQMKNHNSPHLYDFGIVGNCAFNAAINKQAEVIWLCWPKFDSSFIFGKLLDTEKGGCFGVYPIAEILDNKQYYLENTNILCTEFETANGKFRVIDYAPRFLQYDRYFKPLKFFRKIELIEGNPRVKIICEPRDNYGEIIPAVHQGSCHISYSGLSDNLRLTSSIPLNYIMHKKDFLLTENQYLALTYGNPLEAPLPATAEDFLSKTISYWHRWVKHATIGNFQQDALIRSALVLKLHQYEDTGAIIASGTTSLPEHPGSGRNWDYRYCWIRDSYYTISALMNIGHGDELEKFAEYLHNLKPNPDGSIAPVYSILGETDFEEIILPLEGYLGNKPVRIGNQAKTHNQNDVYGQILVSLLPLFLDKKFNYKASAYLLNQINNILLLIEKTMNEPDAGLWEFRNIRQKHCYTYLFHWAGTNSAMRIAEKLNDENMFNKAKKLSKEASENIELCYNKKLKAYAQAQGSDILDASLLQLITLNYLEHDSEKAKLHLNALEKELMGKNGLFYRYKNSDDFGTPESTFLICSFWYIEALACVGRTDEAIERFENLLKYTNHLGLMSEDVNENSGCQWGNFPQTYSHVGLMNAAFRIYRKLDKPDFLLEFR